MKKIDDVQGAEDQGEAEQLRISKGHLLIMKVAVLIVALAGMGCTQPAAPHARQPLQLWYWHHSYLNSPAALASSKTLVDRAVAAGYTGVVLWDTSLVALSAPDWPAENLGYLKEFIRYASGKGLRMMIQVAPYGHSFDVLRQNPNWAEGQRVVGTKFRVAGQTLVHQPQMSVPMDKGEFMVSPWRQYHVRFLSGRGWAGAMDAGDHHKNRMDAATQPGLMDLTFNSAESSRVLVAGQGPFELSETALVYVLRGNGNPLKVYDEGTVYEEGKDYEPIGDRQLATKDIFGADYWHAPEPIRIPPGSRLKDGQEVSMDYNAVARVYGDGVSLCLTEPAIRKWVARNAETLAALFPASSPLMLGYDEVRQMNSCALCRAKGMTAAKLFAANVQETIASLPKRQIYAWSDMFDPEHNAHDHFYSVEGDLSGAGEALPKSVTVMNWNHDKLRKSMQGFARRGYAQVVAGYYDPPDHNGEAAAHREFGKVWGVTGIVGAMYTTWQGDYSQLESYAKAVREEWAKYEASQP
jgi:hypothetical protein